MTLEARTISLSIARDWREAYAFLCVPENFRQWASGLGRLSLREGTWITETPEGRMQVRFTAPNPYGVLDHYVVTPAGAEIYIPLRVFAHGTGSEIVLTLFRQSGMSEEKFAADAEWVRRDLQSLKRLLEG
jgi:hypothetical protein